MKTPQILGLSATILLIVLLFFAPRMSSNVSEPTADSVGEPPTVENQIDSALSLIAGQQPMQGILFLRQLAEENPGNFRAQYHLGRFSAQTAQWDKVLERFEIVSKIDPEFGEAKYWMGLAHFNLGNKDQAKNLLEQFVSEDNNDAQLQMEAEKMLNQ